MRAHHITVILVDDHDLVRRRYISLLGRADGLRVVAHTGDSHHAVELVAQHDPDVVLLDLSMPGLGGLELAREIGGTGPRPAIILLTLEDDLHVAESASAAGAFACLSKLQRMEEIVTAIRAAARQARTTTSGLTQA